MLGGDTRVGWWLFLKAKFGYNDDQIRPYTFNVAPFLTDPKSVQQGYLTSEPLLIEKTGAKINVFLIADAGYAGYGSLLVTSKKLIAEKPDLVQRFVTASIEGWSSYVDGDPSPGNALIKKDNPEQTDELIAYAIARMKEKGIVESGDALQHGVGVMTDARWQEFFDVMSQEGLYPKTMDVKDAYTLRFVDRAAGMSPKN
jgi:NitT/TauT family transport system substrate-binding protein